MKARVPPRQAPEVKARPHDSIKQVRHYKLITPLFGGGVEPNRADPITIVRGTEVRGHLRFWWRATRGGQFDGSPEAMRRAEEAIWGSAAAKDKPGPSDVVVSVAILNRGRPFTVKDSKGRPVRNIGAVNSPYSYVAFPLRDDESNPPVLENVEFELRIRYPSKWEKDVRAALWAWETFGGLGARTRRGFGALQLISVDGQPERLPARDQARAWVSRGLEEHVDTGRFPKDVTHLSQSAAFVLVPRRGQSTEVEVWRYLFDRLRDFRQARHRDSHDRPYGRSKWPEADEVRRLTNTYPPKHKPRHSMQKFPRGQFGLPIIFHFKDRGDPPETRLRGADHERFASALLLRPIACADGAVGLALRLESPDVPPSGYVLACDDGDHTVQVHGLTQSEADEIEPLNGEPDVIQAFLQDLER